MGAVEGGWGAVGEGGEGVGRCEEEGGAEAVVGVDFGLRGHYCCLFYMAGQGRAVELLC